MSGTNEQVQLVEPTPELLAQMLSATRNTPIEELAVVPRGTKIPDGAHFRTENGLHAYKVPKDDFDMAAAFAQAGAVDGIKSYTKAQRQNALEWANRCLAAKGNDQKIYLIFPVSKDKQSVALAMYTRGLWAVKKALTAANTAGFANRFSQTTAKPAAAPKVDPLSELEPTAPADGDLDV